jgi:hypothetical protein
MTDRDVMALLAEANPVRVDDLAQMGFLDLARRRSRGRLSLVVAAAVVASGAAALIVVFAFPRSHPRAGPGPGALGVNTTGSSWQTIALSDASTALGAPVVLPNTDFVQPSDAAPQARTPGCSADSCAIFVSFPAQALGISYTRPAPFADPRAQWAAEVQTAAAHHAKAQLVDLNGVPGDYIDYPRVKRLIQFVTGDTWIVVGGPGDYDKATLQAVAQSIVDRSAAPSPSILAGPGSPVTPVADAAAADGLLPFKVVLPSDTTPTSLGVLEQGHQLDAYFDTPASGPYELVEGPTAETVAVLRETAKQWTVGPIHEIDVVDGVDVLLQGWSDGSLVASWIRLDGGSKILTWVRGPETAERGQVEGTLTKQQALAVVADIIAQGG